MSLCNCKTHTCRSNKRSCKGIGKPLTYIFTTETQIRKLSQGDNSLSLVYSDDTPRISGLDISVATGYLYFSIEVTGTIHRINLSNGTKHYISNVGQPQKLAVDWISQNVYFVNTDSTYRSISLCNFDLQRCAKVIDLGIHGQVSALAVDAINKYVFYAVVNWWVFNSPNYIIYKANLDGTKKTELVKSSPGHISGLTFDCNKRILYYIDRYHGHIHLTNYDGSSHMYIRSNLTNPRELNLFEDHLYFLSSNGHLGRCSLYGEERVCNTFKIQDYYSHLFVISQQSRQPSMLNVCEHNNCSYICVPSEVEARCMCEDGKLVKVKEACPIHTVRNFLFSICSSFSFCYFGYSVTCN